MVIFSRFALVLSVSGNFIETANGPALLFMLVPIVETEPAEYITFVIEKRDKKLYIPLNFIEKVACSLIFLVIGLGYRTTGVII